ncbi:MAG TPA: serine/threonine-protein kinase [Kofleriaceae bacterium]|nr:serine/threonine-protein kinase [Kofleriaceae bacterium]
MSLAKADSRDRVGPYLILRAIGAGGSARVDLARIDRAYNFQRHVVIKRPLEHLRADSGVAESLRREARLGGRLRHPNMVAVLDAGVHDGYDYLALEYVHGTSLRALMQPTTGDPGKPVDNVREVPLAVALGIVVDVCRALHAAHELTDERGSPLGLVHRDVSPGNVLLGLDGAVKLADFGIAKETRVATLSGSIHGTVTYMAPEQCRGHAFDRRADIFSVGVILYELVTRRRLFWADNDVASLHRVLSGQVPPPREVEPSISPALEQLIMNAIAHLPDDRFTNARALADAIEALAASEGHVLGARWLARTLEEEIGPKHAPWIAATTIVQAIPMAEGSLVELIAATPDPEEPIYPTFGPADERSSEEGSVPSAPPPVRAMTAPHTTGFGLRWIVAAGAMLGVLGAVVLSATRHRAAPAAMVAPTTMPTTTPIPMTTTTPIPIPIPMTTTTPAPAPTPTPAIAETKPAAATHRRPRAHASPAPTPTPTPTPVAADVAQPPPTPAAGSAQNHAAWDRNLLLPGDKKP